MTHTSAHDLQEGLGQTGRFGEIFVVLGFIFLLGGVLMWGLGEGHFMANHSEVHGASTDAITVGFLYAIMGGGFMVFGVMIMLSGWGRHHANFEF